MSTTKTLQVTAAVLALASSLALTGCTGAQSATPAPSGTSSSIATTAAPVSSDAPAPVETTAAPVADANSQVVNGTLYAGTEMAPVKIGSDTPGQAPAAQASFPATSGFDAMKAASIALDATKYTVRVSPKYAPDDNTAQKPPIGYMWQVFRVNEYGNWKAVVRHEDTETFPAKQAALDAPKSLEGRTLDRAEYVLVSSS